MIYPNCPKKVQYGFTMYLCIQNMQMDWQTVQTLIILLQGSALFPQTYMSLFLEFMVKPAVTLSCAELCKLIVKLWSSLPHML